MSDRRISSGLLDKKILFLSPAFFNYERAIQKKMEEMGAVVTFYDERAIKSSFDKALLKISPALFRKKARDYYNQILSENMSQDFDYVLIVKCDMISGETLEQIRRAFPKSKLCLHLWDSIKNIPGIQKKFSYFDHATSFDRNDCIYEKRLNFRPLFYTDAFCREAGQALEEYRYDLAFCGTIHSDRYRVLKGIEEQCKTEKLRYYAFYYLQSKFIYYFYCIFKRSFWGTKKAQFSFDKKTHDEIAEIERSSKVIIDIQHPSQSGLTMRTIEMLGMHKKLITTNQDIKNYDFYDPANICVIDRYNPSISRELIESPYKCPAEGVYKKYNLESWINDVLGIGGNQV